MTTAIQTAANIITETALEALAAKHGRTVAEVVAAMRAGNDKLATQFSQLARAGVEAAMQLNEQGRIGLTAA